MLIKLIIAAAITAAVFILLWLMRGVMLMPVRKSKNQSLSVTLRVSGPSPGLEETVDGLLWLIRNGTLPAKLYIEDAGMDAETRREAELICGGGDIILKPGA